MNCSFRSKTSKRPERMPDRAGKEPRLLAKRLYSPEYCPPEYRSGAGEKGSDESRRRRPKKEEIEIETQVLQIRKEKEETKQELERSEALEGEKNEQIEGFTKDLEEARRQ